MYVRIISRKILREFWEKRKYRDSENPLREWETEVKKAAWRNSSVVKNSYNSASILKNNHVVFDIKGNAYRLVVSINYNYRIVFIRFIGTHKQYDKINAEEI